MKIRLFFRLSNLYYKIDKFFEDYENEKNKDGFDIIEFLKRRKK